MEIDLDSKSHDYTTIPPGRYLCQVAEVRPGITRAGDERWSLRLTVVDGPHVGKQAAWDSLVFSARGRIRARHVFAALGLPSAGKVQIEPKDVEHRKAWVEVRPATYTSPDGAQVTRNEVPYDGYSPPDGGDSTTPGAFVVGVRMQHGRRGAEHSCALEIVPGLPGSSVPPSVRLRTVAGKTTFIEMPDHETARQIAYELLRVTAPINLGQ